MDLHEIRSVLLRQTQASHSAFHLNRLRVWPVICGQSSEANVVVVAVAAAGMTVPAAVAAQVLGDEFEPGHGS